MAKIRIGKIRPTTEGVYNSATTYSLLATVTNAEKTKVYASLVENNQGNPLTDTTKWELLLDAQTAVDNATRKEVVAKTASDTTPELEQNKMYEFPEMETLNFTLATPVANELNEYQFSFNSGATATIFGYPENVEWTSEVKIEANMHYEISIEYNQTDDAYYGIIVGWATS